MAIHSGLLVECVAVIVLTWMYQRRVKNAGWLILIVGEGIADRQLVRFNTALVVKEKHVAMGCGYIPGARTTFSSNRNSVCREASIEK